MFLTFTWLAQTFAWQIIVWKKYTNTSYWVFNREQEPVTAREVFYTMDHWITKPRLLIVRQHLNVQILESDKSGSHFKFMTCTVIFFTVAIWPCSPFIFFFYKSRNIFQNRFMYWCGVIYKSNILVEEVIFWGSKFSCLQFTFG